MNRELLLHRHKELVPTQIEFHQASFFTQPAIKAPPPSHQIQHRQALIVPHRQREFPRRVQSEIVDSLLVRRESLEVNEGIGIVDTNRAVGGGGDEVAGEVEIGRGVEGEGGDGGGVVMERTEGGGGGEVVEVDSVVGAAGCNDGAGDGDGFDEREVGGIGEERS